MDAVQAMTHMLEELDRRYLNVVQKLSSETQGSNAHLRHLAAGTCAVVAYIDKSECVMHVANLGDSRAVLGKTSNLMPGIIDAIEVTVDHSVKTDSERHRIREEHRGDAQVVTERWDDYEYVWLLKGRARFSRSIGDVIFKDAKSAEFYNSRIDNHEAHRRMIPLPQKAHPYVSNRPEITSRKIVQGDQFLVVACDGLWDELSSDQVVRVVQCLLAKHGGKANIAQLLVQFTLSKVAQRLAVEEPELEIFTHEDLRAMPPGDDGRRELHDDITVIVLLFDQRYLASDKVANSDSNSSVVGSVASSVVGANTPLKDCTPMATPRSARTDNSQASLLAAADNVEMLLAQESSAPDELSAAGSWFGSSLLAKAPHLDVRKAVERHHPSVSDTLHAKKNRLDSTPSLSAQELLGQRTPSATLSSESPRESSPRVDGGDTTRSCTITEQTPRDDNKLLRVGTVGSISRAAAIDNDSNGRMSSIDTHKVMAQRDHLDSQRSYLDSGRSLPSIDEETPRAPGIGTLGQPAFQPGLPRELWDLSDLADGLDETPRSPRDGEAIQI